MRFSLGGVALMMLMGMQVAQAVDFCGPDRDMLGGGCKQESASLPPMLAGDRGGFASALPNSSALDLRTCQQIGCDAALQFELDLSFLSLDAPTPNDETKAKLVDVLQLGVLSPGLYAAGQNGYRVLAMSILRGQSGNAYTVGFSWREEYEPSTEIRPDWNFPGELSAAFGDLADSERFVTVSIRPVDGDWLNPKVDLGARISRAQPYRNVVLGFVEADGSVASPAAKGDSLAPPQGTFPAQPWSLRSGIIGGDLDHVGMTTKFHYQTPWVRAIYRASAGLPPEW